MVALRPALVVFGLLGLFALPGFGQQPSIERGLQLFAEQCAVCHGPAGRGFGPVAPMLHPSPRDFGRASFKIVSTSRRVPDDADLLGTLRHGLPGSAMPAFDHLPERDLDDLVAAVRQLVLDARVARIMERDDVDRELAERTAARDLDPGARLELPPEPRPSLERLERGRDLFITNCASCHDLDGRARERTDLVDVNGRPVMPRDLTRGVFKGGHGTLDIARRILLGLPGTAMPITQLEHDDVWSLAQYVRGLTDGADTELQRQTRRALVAHRVEGRLDAHLQVAAWAEASEFVVPLMPMVWRQDRPETLSVRALHDGRLLALRLSWDDRTRDAGAKEGHAPDDGLAVQFASAFDPPFFGMGAADDAVSVIQWRAAWQAESEAGSLPVLTPRGGADVDWPVEDAAARGPGRLHVTRAAGDVRARGLHVRDRWDVIVLRELPVDSQTLSVGFAVWDGSGGDEAATKSVTVWHHLLLGE